MKLVPTLLLSTSVALFIVGVHQTFTVGILDSYWIFMFCVGFLLLYKVKKEKDVSPFPQNPTSAQSLPTSKAGKKASAKSPKGAKEPDKPSSKTSTKSGGETKASAKPSTSSHQTRK